MGRDDRLEHSHPRGKSATGLGARPGLHRLPPLPQGEPSRVAGKVRGAPPAGTPKRERTIPKGARTQTHTREKRRGRGLTLLPRATTWAHKVHNSLPPPGAGSRPRKGRPVPSARRAGAGVRGEGSPGRLTRSGAWPPRLATRPWSLRARRGAGGARAPRVRRSQSPPRPSFTFSALTHRPPSRAGGGQPPGRNGRRGWNRPRQAGARARGEGPTRGGGAGSKVRRAPGSTAPAAARLRSGRLCQRRASGAGAGRQRGPRRYPLRRRLLPRASAPGREGTSLLARGGPGSAPRGGGEELRRGQHLAAFRAGRGGRTDGRTSER